MPSWIRSLHLPGLETRLAKGFILGVLPIAILLLCLLHPFRSDASYKYSGITYGLRPGLLSGEPSIEPNIGVTSQALGTLATREIFQGRLPLWNHYQGLGAPLLGEMQVAALFPPTWLMALPNGQTLEQTLLQILAGIGAFLFFQSFGIGIRAALTGAVVFEVNGVFAWLRNAIFNPVAVLPWLFLVIEHLIRGAAKEPLLRHRAPVIAFGAITSALSLYAGFPEEVYLYGLMLVAWTVFRATTLAPKVVLRLATDLALMGALALALAAPLLVAFVDYLGQAQLGRHADGGFAGVSLDPGALLQYISPYVYGRIFGSDVPYVNGIWGGIGGYVGVLPVILALASLAVPGRQGAKLFLWGWIVVAVGVSEGVPGIFDVFTLIPLTTTAASCRYLNASWIFGLIFLSTLFLDAAPALPVAQLRRMMVSAAVCGILIIAGAVTWAWPLVSTVASTSSYDLLTLLSGLALTVLLALMAAGVSWSGSAARSATLLSCLLIVEALAWFVYPLMSLPRGGKLDVALVAWLRDHAGFGRVLNTAEANIGVNYGSYFGLGLINYADLPTPRVTAAYVHDKLDPYSGDIDLMPVNGGLSPEAQADQRHAFRARLTAYAEAGVRFVLSGRDFDLFSPFDLMTEAAEPYPLAPGQELRVEATEDPYGAVPVSGLGVTLAATPGSGRLTATVCSGSDCASGSADLAIAPENGRFKIALDRPVTLAPGAVYSVRLYNEGGDSAVAFAMRKFVASDGPPSVSSNGSAISEQVGPDLVFRDDRVSLAYVGQAMRVYALRGARDYVSAPGCALDALTRDEVTAVCEAPSRLVRLEAAMQGWSATANQASIRIDPVEGAFQAIDLPAGTSLVQFSYEPARFRPALLAAGIGALTLVSIGFMSRHRRNRSSRRHIRSSRTEKH